MPWSNQGGWPVGLGSEGAVGVGFPAVGLIAARS